MIVKIRQLVKVAMLAATMVTTPSLAGVFFYTFEGTSANGDAKASMFLDMDQTRIRITLNNTSPTTLVGGTGVNAPAITGFGLNFLNPDDFTLTTWNLFALKPGNISVCIGSNAPSCSGTNPWVLEAAGPGQPLDLFVSTSPGSTVQGGLYNPAATGGLAAAPNYFTEATFEIQLAQPNTVVPQIEELFNGQCNQGHPCSPFVRMQNVGEDGEGSLRLSPGGPFPPTGVPEPGTLALLGMAIVAGALAKRKARG
jgi:hypothetical protein